MPKYSSSELKKINKDHKKIFKESGCRLLSNDEMQNVSDSMKMLDSSDVKIIKNAQNGNYAEFNAASALVRNYVGTLSLRKMVEETGVAQEQLALSNPQVKKYVQDHVLDAGFRTGLAALKHTFPKNVKFKELDEYANEHMLAKTLALPSQEKADALKRALGESKANAEMQKNLSKQVVLAKTLFLAQLGQYKMKENGVATEYKGSIAETFAHGGRTNFILPHNDVNNEVLNAFDGGEIGNDHKLVGDHHQRQERQKYHVVSSEIKPCKGKCRRNRDHQHQNGGCNRKNSGVEEISSHICRAKALNIVFNGRRKGYKLRNIFCVISARALERGQYHPVEREKHYQSPEDQHSVNQYL